MWKLGGRSRDAMQLLRGGGASSGVEAAIVRAEGLLMPIIDNEEDLIFTSESEWNLDSLLSPLFQIASWWHGCCTGKVSSIRKSRCERHANLAYFSTPHAALLGGLSPSLTPVSATRPHNQGRIGACVHVIYSLREMLNAA